MNVKFGLVLFMLLEAGWAKGEEGWSWGKDENSPAVVGAKEVEGRIANGHISFAADPESSSPGIDTLPLEPHDVPEGDLQLTQTAGARGGRFLGLGERLCSLGLSSSCNKDKNRHDSRPVTHYGTKKVDRIPTSYGPPPPPPLGQGYGRPTYVANNQDTKKQPGLIGSIMNMFSSEKDAPKAIYEIPGSVHEIPISPPEPLYQPPPLPSGYRPQTIYNPPKPVQKKGYEVPYITDTQRLPSYPGSNQRIEPVYSPPNQIPIGPVDRDYIPSPVVSHIHEHTHFYNGNVLGSSGYKKTAAVSNAGYSPFSDSNLNNLQDGIYREDLFSKTAVSSGSNQLTDNNRVVKDTTSGFGNSFGNQIHQSQPVNSFHVNNVHGSSNHESHSSHQHLSPVGHQQHQQSGLTSFQQPSTSTGFKQTTNLDFIAQPSQFQSTQHVTRGISTHQTNTFNPNTGDNFHHTSGLNANSVGSLPQPHLSGFPSQSASHGFTTNSAHHVNQETFSQPISNSGFSSPGQLHGGHHHQSQIVQHTQQNTDFNTLYQLSQRLYREDCQCIPAQYCSASDIIPRNNNHDIRNIIEARTKQNTIYANPDYNDVNSTDSSARQAKELQLDEQDLYEAETEEYEGAESTTLEPEVEEPGTEDRRKRSLLEEEEEQEEEGTGEKEKTGTSGRQGRQLTGFTPGLDGCGRDHVCCRRPVYVAPRHLPACGRGNNRAIHGRVLRTSFEKSEAQFGEYPWQAVILRKESGQLMYECGAALVDAQHVVTAGHCVNELKVQSLKVRLGEWDVNNDSEFHKYLQFDVAQKILHPEFYSGNLVNDIAILRLERPVDFAANPHILPVCLPDPAQDFTFHKCQVTGYGKDAHGSAGQFQNVLQEVEVPVVPRDRCQDTLRTTKLGPDFQLHPGMMCAGGERNRDACKGDGGGPLVCRGVDGAYQFVGIVSWGIGCGHEGIPGVYVKVAHYVDWIRGATGIL